MGGQVSIEHSSEAHELGKAGLGRMQREMADLEQEAYRVVIIIISTIQVSVFF